MIRASVLLVPILAVAACGEATTPEAEEAATDTQTATHATSGDSIDPGSSTTTGSSGPDGTSSSSTNGPGETTQPDPSETGDPSTTTSETGTTTGDPTNPEFPDASNTGVPPGTRLTECDPNIMSPGVYDGCHFMSPVTLFTDDVTIRRSKIEGYIRSDLTDLQDVVFEDIEVDAHDNTTFNAVAVDGYTCQRCQVHDARVCFGGSGMTIEDSYCFDLHGEGDPATDGTHNEAIIAFGTRPIVIRHNNLVANWNETTTGGGMSAVVAIYSHGIFGPLGNVTLDSNRLENTSGAFYCMYSGQDTFGPSGIAVTDNVFVLEDAAFDRGCSSPSYPDWVSSRMNEWSGNTHEDGSEVPEPPSQ